jgi:hypothetical protein
MMLRSTIRHVLSKIRKKKKKGGNYYYAVAFGVYGTVWVPMSIGLPRMSWPFCSMCS